MDTRILSIKLSQEAKQWDSMCTKLYQFLAETTEDRQQMFSKNQKDQEAKLLALHEQRLVKKSTQTGQDLDVVRKQDTIRLEKLKDEELKNQKAKGKDFESGFDKNKMEQFLKEKKYAQKTFDTEEKELISCAFKCRLQELVEGIAKVDILIKKSKFQEHRNELEQYKKGLLQDFLDEALTMRMVLQNLCIKISGHPVGLMFFYKLKADIYRYLAEYQYHFTSVAKDHQHQIRSNADDDEIMKCLGRYFPNIIILKDDSQKEIKKKTEDREQKFNFTKKAHSNYKKALYIEEYHKHKMIQKQLSDQQKEKHEDEQEGYKISSLSLAITLNYSVYLWGIKKDQKKALRMCKRKLQESLEDFELWDKEEMDSIKKQIQLMQENINMWKEKTDTDSEEEN